MKNSSWNEGLKIIDKRDILLLTIENDSLEDKTYISISYAPFS